MSNQPCPSYALIDGVEISELDLLRYEMKRARIAASLLYEKIGPENVTELLKREIATMVQIEREWVQRSAGKLTGSITEVRVKGGRIAEFARGRYAQIKHHNRDNYGDDAVREGFEPR